MVRKIAIAENATIIAPATANKTLGSSTLRSAMATSVPANVPGRQSPFPLIGPVTV